MISGLLIAVMSALEIATYRRWAGWFNFALVNFVLGALVFISPVVMRFTGEDAATWTIMLAGLVVAASAFAELWRFTA